MAHTPSPCREDMRMMWIMVKYCEFAFNVVTILLTLMTHMQHIYGLRCVCSVHDGHPPINVLAGGRDLKGTTKAPKNVSSNIFCIHISFH